MATGVPVLTTAFESQDRFNEHVLSVSSFTAEGVAEALLQACEGREDSLGVARKAQEYVASVHSWDSVAAELAERLSNLQDAQD